MKGPDEPLFPEADPGGEAVPEPALPARIRHLVETEPYAVLCTQGGGQPYGSVVAFAFSRDLRHAVFATLTTTRKFRLLSECDHVALVVDDRPGHPNDLMEVQAVTVTGRAVRVDPGGERDELAALLQDRHAYLASFLGSPSCALFRIDVLRFFHVTRFQEVREWTPPPGG